MCIRDRYIAASKIIAEAGGTTKVKGSTIATPFTDPKPGMAPIKSPAVTPRITISKLNGESEVAKPSDKSVRRSILFPNSEKLGVKRKEQWLTHPFRQHYFQGHFKEEEHHYWGQNGNS